MGIFDFLKKPGKEAAKTVQAFEHDKAKYQWDSAAGEYCRQNGKTIDALEYEDYEVIDEYAGNHIAFFLTWLIQNGFYVPEDDFPDIAEAAEAVKREELRGIEFLMGCGGGVLSREELAEEIRGFVDGYYDPGYMNEYTAFIENELHKPVLGVRFSWEEYHSFAPRIDAAYDHYRGRGRA